METPQVKCSSHTEAALYSFLLLFIAMEKAFLHARMFPDRTRAGPAKAPLPRGPRTGLQN